MGESRAEWLDRIRSVGYLGHGRTRATRVQAEGRHHPDSDLPFVTRRDENDNTTTEHGVPGTAVSSRQDAHVYQREPVTATIEVPRHE